jgi:hypothetical protein
MSVHKISLEKMGTRDTTPHGSRSSITKANFPILRGMALYRLLIEEGCFREPHWPGDSRADGSGHPRTL